MITKMAIVYCSRTDNTKELANLIKNAFHEKQQHLAMFHVEKLPDTFSLGDYDVVLLGTYSWGKGEIPREMKSFYEKFEKENCKHLTTGVFGTGDRFYPNFCGAVDRFRDMLFVRTNLAVTLKVELAPQKNDEEKCKLFVEKILEKHQKSRVA